MLCNDSTTEKVGIGTYYCAVRRVHGIGILCSVPRPREQMAISELVFSGIWAAVVIHLEAAFAASTK